MIFLLGAMALILVPIGAKADNFFFAAGAPDHNNKIVGNLLARVSSIRGNGEAYAVFDWDNTCMFGDISYTSVLYQVENLNFRLNPDNFESFFSLGYNASSSDICLPHGTNSVLRQDVNDNDVTLAKVLASTAEDYKVLYSAYIAPTYIFKDATAKVTLKEIKKSIEYHNFRAKIAFLLFGLEAMDGGDDHAQCAMTIAMTVLPQLLVGMTRDEIQDLIRSSIRWNLAEALDDPTFISKGDLQVEGSYTKGLRFFSGQESTMRALRAAAVEVYIISASPQLFAAEARNLIGLDNIVPSANVYGVRFQFDAARRFTGKLIDKYPITWGPGKAKIITSLLMPKHHGAFPIYASGDSDGDCEMMDLVRDGVIDTNNRLKDSDSCIHEFYVKSCKYFKATEQKTNNVYLLQGQDQAIGMWITSGYSTRDGVIYTSTVDPRHHCTRY
ncbi:hypothetical protein CCR75_003172 [Bremia lactucae]|uniref:Uncharacterized protein n=1 Tax=Bremia lactucae TaxID=4779 RepID=A0A976NYF1_BRELC|nr:hypothetical protein CCR75_003172 [Bremia lactucae]